MQYVVLDIDCDSVMSLQYHIHDWKWKSVAILRRRRKTSNPVRVASASGPSEKSWGELNVSTEPIPSLQIPILDALTSSPVPLENDGCVHGERGCRYDQRRACTKGRLIKENVRSLSRSRTLFNLRVRICQRGSWKVLHIYVTIAC